MKKEWRKRMKEGRRKRKKKIRKTIGNSNEKISLLMGGKRRRIKTMKAEGKDEGDCKKTRKRMRNRRERERETERGREKRIRMMMNDHFMDYLYSC